MRLPLFISAILLILLASCYGAQQTINIGTTPSDGTGDSLRTAFGKVNTNFTELYSLTSAINASNITTGTLPIARIADGSVTNAKLANSAITINGSAVSLGQSISVSASTNLTGLTDVTITSAATNDFLVKSAGDWVNLTPANARTALGLGTLATQSATITDFAPLNNPTFDSRINIAGGGVASGLLHIFDADSSHSVRLVTASSLAENYELTLPSHTGTLVSSSTGAGGVLSGTYPNPGFATDMAEQSELNSGLATKEDVQTAASQAEAEAGTESAIRKFSPLRVKQAVTALAPRGSTVNVKNYGALGNAQKVTDAASTNGSTTVTSASGRFTAGDVGKVVWGVNTGTKLLAVPLGTITAYTSATQITVSIAATASATGLHLVWGADDTDAIQAAAAAAKAMQPRGLVEVPAGGYIFDELLFDLTESAAGKAGGVFGHGTGSTIFYPSPAHDLASTAMLALSNGNCYDTRVEGFSVEGSYYQWSASGKHVIQLGGFTQECVRDVRVDYLYGTTSGLSTTGYFTKLERVYLESLGYIGLSVSSGGSVWIADSIFANCGLYSISVDGITGTLNNKAFVRIENTWIDESNNGCLDVNNSTDVVLTGCRVSAPQTYAGLIVRGNSTVRAVGCELLPWGTSGNRPGVDVASGSTLWLSNCRVDSSGTSHALTNAGTVYLSATRIAVSGTGTGLVNTGTVVDGGGNSVASRSGAGTTTTAVMNWINGPTGATMVIAPAAGQNLQFYPTSGGNITCSGSLAVNAGISMADAQNIAVGTATGTKFGTGTTQKMGFWNATPVVQQTLSTGAGATVDQVITLLQTLGLCKQ